MPMQLSSTNLWILRVLSTFLLMLTLIQQVLMLMLMLWPTGQYSVVDTEPEPWSTFAWFATPEPTRKAGLVVGALGFYRVSL